MTDARPSIHTSADLGLWLDGWDAGAATTLRSLAAVPADMLPAVVATRAADLNLPGTVAGAAPTQP